MQPESALPPEPSNYSARTEPVAPTPSCHVAKSMASERRVVFILLVLACQAVALAILIHPIIQASDDYRYIPIYSMKRIIVEPIIFFIVGFALLRAAHLALYWRSLVDCARNHSWWRPAILQMVCYFFIIYSASSLRPTKFFSFTGMPDQLEGFWSLLLAASIFTTSIFSLGAIAPREFWVDLAKTEKTTLFILTLSISAYVGLYVAQQSWDILSEPTMKVSTFSLGLIYPDLYIDPERKILGTDKFTVSIVPGCAGYDGIGLIIMFLTWYIRSHQDELRLPTALLLIPIGIGVIWIFNALRITLIIVVGTAISADIAMQGFHASAGWIILIAVSLSVVFAARRSQFFSKQVVAHQIIIDSFNAPAIPFLVMLATTLISGAMSAEFPWSYPIRPIAAGIVILMLWKYFDLRVALPGLLPVLAGIIVFFIWLALVPPSGMEDEKLAENLFAVSGTISINWIAFRLLGAVIVVPIAEELAFRKYLLSFFPEKRTRPEAKWGIQWIPMIVSSVLFGALHDAWIAGTLAGIVYYLVRERSGRLWDSIVAHATTNFFLSVYVLTSGHLSYW